jgi:hypothetical protein
MVTIAIDRLDGVDHFQTSVDVVDHFQSPVDERDDLYSLHRVDPFLVRHGRCGLFLVIHTLLRSLLTAWKNTNSADHFHFPNAPGSRPSSTHNPNMG